MNIDRDQSFILPLADYSFAIQTLASLAGIAAGLEPRELAKAVRKTSRADRENLHRLALTILCGTTPKLAAAAEAFSPSTER